MKTGLLIFFVLCCLSAKSQKIPAWKITDVADYFSKKNDTVYVINFWATFCLPCIAEIPFMQEITKKYADKKVKLLLVSLDMASAYPKEISLFAQQRSFTSDIVWLNETDADYFCDRIDKKWSGAIPATIMVNAATGYRKFYEQEFKEEEFELELVKALGTGSE